MRGGERALHLSFFVHIFRADGMEVWFEVTPVPVVIITPGIPRGTILAERMEEVSRGQ